MVQKIVIESVLKVIFLRFSSKSRWRRFFTGIRMKIYVDETTIDILERIRNMMDEEET